MQVMYKYQRQNERQDHLMDIIRENQKEYNKFISQKVPKLLAQLAVSSSSDDDGG